MAMSFRARTVRRSAHGTQRCPDVGIDAGCAGSGLTQYNHAGLRRIPASGVPVHTRPAPTTVTAQYPTLARGLGRSADVSALRVIVRPAARQRLGPDVRAEGTQVRQASV